FFSGRTKAYILNSEKFLSICPISEKAYVPWPNASIIVDNNQPFIFIILEILNKSAHNDERFTAMACKQEPGFGTKMYILHTLR
uniref:Uncharacterized protein n=1 Tax=Romanomermis culicivorax TaxID=13658 RepID=A0A915L7C2_ROMCU